MKTECRGPRFTTILRLSRPNTLYGRNYVPPKYDFPLSFKCPPVEKYNVPRSLREIRSLGIRKLSKPRIKHPKFIRPDRAGPPYPPVCPLALTYIPTSNVLLLAQPKKMYVDPNLRENPYAISKKIVKATHTSVEKVLQSLGHTTQS